MPYASGSKRSGTKSGGGPRKPRGKKCPKCGKLKTTCKCKY